MSDRQALFPRGGRERPGFPRHWSGCHLQLHIRVAAPQFLSNRGPAILSDTLKTIYLEAKLADRYWDEATPLDLWRLQKKSDFDARTLPLQPLELSLTMLRSLARFATLEN